MTDVLWKSFAETDERYLDLFRVGYALGMLVFLGLQTYAVIWLDQAFDPVAFGAGFGALLFGSGIGVGVRGRLEDGPSPVYTGPKDPEPARGEPRDGPPPGANAGA